MSKKQPALQRALRDLSRALRPHDVRWMIIGGLAVIARGHPRTTRDIDLTVADLAAGELLGKLASKRILPRIEDAEAFAALSEILPMVHQPTGVPIDVSFARLGFELDALARREEVDLDGVTLPIASVEDLLVYKLIAGRPRDIEDARSLAELHAATLDRPAIREILQQLSRAVGEEDFLRAWDQIIDRMPPGPGRGRPRRSKKRE